MCFRINTRIRRAPRQREAWKVVRVMKRSGYVRSEHKKYQWRTGEHAIPSDSTTTYYSYGGKPYAHEGFYVFLDLDYAKAYLKRVNAWVPPTTGYYLQIMRLVVSPKDFLYQGLKTDNRHIVATYSKVTVPEEQPYFDWY